MMMRTILSVILFVGMLSVLPASAQASHRVKHSSLPVVITSVPQDPDSIDVADIKPMSDSDMDNLRGGFVDPTGLIYRFSIDVQVALDGSKIYSRSFTLAPTGPSNQLQATSTTNLAAQTIPNNLNVNLLNNGSGLIITDAKGHTTSVLNQTSAGAPASIIINTADNRTISQSVKVSLTTQNTPFLANSQLTNSIGSALAQHSVLHSIGF